MNLNHRASINLSNKSHNTSHILSQGVGGGGDMSILELSHGHFRGEYLKRL